MLSLPLTPAPEALFYARKDVHDRRLGEWVERDPAAYEGARVVIVGCPQDEGVRRNGGRPGAAQAPNEIRRALYRLTTNGLDDLRLFDAGNLTIQHSLEGTHDAQQAVVQRLLVDGKRVVVLGGGNDISFPDCSALAAVAPRTLAFNIDAHFDVRADERRNSGTPYRQLLDGGRLQPRLFYQIGSQPFANSATYARYLADLGVRVFPLDGVLKHGVAMTIEGILSDQPEAEAVFWGFDLDVVRASDAPGVSAPNPCGMSATDFCAIATIAGREPRTRVVEFSEVNPAFDLDGRTSRLAAVAIYHYLAALATSR